jgi:pyruvate/2-oxoglutarate/acetoin dehydrogenase E1 component
MEGAFHELDGPVLRVCAAEVPMPYSRHLEEAALPRVEAVVASVRRLVGGGGA